MKYLLVVGFICDVYRKKPQARIIVDNKLIDEYDIQQHTDLFVPTLKKLLQQEILHPRIETSLDLQLKFLPPLKFYKIEINPNQNKIDLRIEIQNQDNNYTNGFISRSTLIELRVCYFFPLDKELILRLKKIREKKISKKNYGWYRRDANCFFNLTEQAISWYGANSQIVNSKNPMFYIRKFGGDGIFKVELIKKYKIFVTKTTHPYRFRLQYTLLKHFLDKYQQHENQRNND